MSRSTTGTYNMNTHMTAKVSSAPERDTWVSFFAYAPVDEQDRYLEEIDKSANRRFAAERSVGYIEA